VAASIVPRRRCLAEIVDGGHRRSRHEFREIRSLLAQPLIEHFDALEPVTIMSMSALAAIQTLDSERVQDMTDS
jgi:hypothetical protein